MARLSLAIKRSTTIQRRVADDRQADDARGLNGRMGYSPPTTEASGRVRAARPALHPRLRHALHLRLGSQRENLADARAEGSLSRRLTAEQARETVKLAGEGLERHELAERDKSNGG